MNAVGASSKVSKNLSSSLRCNSSCNFLRGFSCNKGFSLFELVIVIVLIALLFAYSAFRYEKHIGSSQEKVIGFQANTFARVIENVHAMAVAKNTREIVIGDSLVVYINKHGWPVGTNYLSNKKVFRASHNGCLSLWSGLFKTVIETDPNSTSVNIENFDISLIDNTICRYKLSRKQEGSFFFDYDVITGRVVITLPS